MKYIIECSSGICTHPEHKINMLLYIIPIVVLLALISKYVYDSNKN